MCVCVYVRVRMCAHAPPQSSVVSDSVIHSPFLTLALTLALQVPLSLTALQDPKAKSLEFSRGEISHSLDYLNQF